MPPEAASPGVRLRPRARLPVFTGPVDASVKRCHATPLRAPEGFPSELEAARASRPVDMQKNARTAAARCHATVNSPTSITSGFLIRRISLVFISPDPRLLLDYAAANGSAAWSSLPWRGCVIAEGPMYGT